MNNFRGALQNGICVAHLWSPYGLYALILLIGIVIGLSVVRIDALFTIMLVAGVLSFIVMFFKPELGILAFIILAIKIVPIWMLPDIRFAGGGIDIVDLGIFAVFLVLFSHLILKKDFSRLFHPVSLPILIYFALACFSATLALLKGVPSLRVFGELRTVFYFLIFFPVVYFVDADKKFSFLFMSLLIISILISFGAVANYFVDFPFLNFFGFGSEDLRTAGVEAVGVTRPSIPGTLLVFILFLSCVSFLVFTRQRKTFSLLGSLLFGIPIFLRFSRNLWVSGFFAVVFVVLVYCWINRHSIGSIKFWLFLSGLSFLVTFYIFLLENVTLQSQFLHAIRSRTASIFSSLERQDDTLHGRLLENQLALRKIRENPLEGIGLGNSYYAPQEVWGVRQSAFEEDGATRYIHNGWLYIPLKMGIPTLMVFIWLCVVFIRSNLADLSRTRGSIRIAFRVAFSAAFFGFLLQSLVANRFCEPKHMVVMGLLIGLTTALARNKDRNTGVTSTPWTRI